MGSRYKNKSRLISRALADFGERPRHLSRIGASVQDDQEPRGSASTNGAGDVDSRHTAETQNGATSCKPESQTAPPKHTGPNKQGRGRGGNTRRVYGGRDSSVPISTASTVFKHGKNTEKGKDTKSSESSVNSAQHPDSYRSVSLPPKASTDEQNQRKTSHNKDSAVRPRPSSAKYQGRTEEKESRKRRDQEGTRTRQPNSQSEDLTARQEVEEGPDQECHYPPQSDVSERFQNLDVSPPKDTLVFTNRKFEDRKIEDCRDQLSDQIEGSEVESESSLTDLREDFTDKIQFEKVLSDENAMERVTVESDGEEKMGPPAPPADLVKEMDPTPPPSGLRTISAIGRGRGRGRSNVSKIPSDANNNPEFRPLSLDVGRSHGNQAKRPSDSKSQFAPSSRRFCGEDRSVVSYESYQNYGCDTRQDLNVVSPNSASTSYTVSAQFEEASAPHYQPPWPQPTPTPPYSSNCGAYVGAIYNPQPAYAPPVTMEQQEFSPDQRYNAGTSFPSIGASYYGNGFPSQQPSSYAYTRTGNVGNRYYNMEEAAYIVPHPGPLRAPGGLQEYNVVSSYGASYSHHQPQHTLSHTPHVGHVNHYYAPCPPGGVAYFGQGQQPSSYVPSQDIFQPPPPPPSVEQFHPAEFTRPTSRSSSLETPSPTMSLPPSKPPSPALLAPPVKTVRPARARGRGRLVKYSDHEVIKPGFSQPPPEPADEPSPPQHPVSAPSVSSDIVTDVSPPIGGASIEEQVSDDGPEDVTPLKDASGRASNGENAVSHGYDSSSESVRGEDDDTGRDYLASNEESEDTDSWAYISANDTWSPKPAKESSNYSGSGQYSDGKKNARRSAPPVFSTLDTIGENSSAPYRKETTAPTKRGGSNRCSSALPTSKIAPSIKSGPVSSVERNEWSCCSPYDTPPSGGVKHLSDSASSSSASQMSKKVYDMNFPSLNVAGNVNDDRPKLVHNTTDFPWAAPSPQKTADTKTKSSLNNRNRRSWGASMDRNDYSAQKSDDSPSQRRKLYSSTESLDRISKESPQRDWTLRHRYRLNSSQQPYVDSHCHIDFLFNRSKYSGTWSSYKAKKAETFMDNYEGCVTNFCDPNVYRTPFKWTRVLEEADVWASFGCHPKSVGQFTPDAEAFLIDMMSHKKVVSLGEIGLDYSGKFYEQRDVQKKAFIKQLDIAVKYQKPLVIHCREAEADCLKIMKQYVPQDWPIHRHCFTDKWQVAKPWLDYFHNCYLGLTPVVTYASAKNVHEVAKKVPLNRLLLETDAPYFVPSYISRSQMTLSTPGLAVCVADEVARLRLCEFDDVLSNARDNTRKMYAI